MAWTEMQSLIQLTATVVGIAGGLLALYRYSVEKRDKELREWQKVVLFKILRQNEERCISFSELLEKYRIEAQSFTGIDLKKAEMSEDVLRRVMIELCSSGLVSIEAGDTYLLKVTVRSQGVEEIVAKVNQELLRLVAPNPYVYTLDEVLKEMSPKVGIEIPLLKNDLKEVIRAGRLCIDDKNRLAFP